MRIPNISLAYQIAELKPIVEGSILRKVQELGNGWLKLKLQTRQGTKDLIASSDAVFLTSYSMPAKQQTSGYGAFLRKKLSNKKIVSFRQHGLDRIAIMQFQEFFLIFELFAKGNVILTDNEMKILSAFRKEQWKDRTLKKNELYKFPSSKGINPLELDKAKLHKLFSESGKDVVRTIVSEVNIAPSFAEEACMRAGLEKEKNASELGAKEVEQVIKAIKALYTVSVKEAKPVLAEKDSKQILLPFQLNLQGISELQSFASLNEALDRLYSKQFSQIKVPKSQAVNKKKIELEKSMQQQKEALQTLQGKIEENSQKAELIYANYARLAGLVEAAHAAKGQKLKEKEIMYKLKKRFSFLQSVDLKKGTLVVSLQK